MLTKIKKVKFEPEYKNPVYKVLLECPSGNKLFIKFDYTHSMKRYMPLNVEYNGTDKGAKLAWYTSEVENMTVETFLEKIAGRINKKYNFKLEEKR
ncbi:MAG TPA: hypothetical protein VNM45_14940 [Bacillus sp. (in: firmicutes)]|nr:hypothetical protein [Bacillus sp. (in: firmicutes)]